MPVSRFVIFAILAFFLALPVQARENEQPSGLVEASTLKKLLKEDPEGLIVIDVRTPGEFNEGHLTRARNINFFGPRFEQDIDVLPKDGRIVVYCKSGRRSEGAAQIMRDAGFRNVSSLKGGINAWKKAGGKILGNSD